MHVADDVERAVFVTLVVVQRHALHRGGIDLSIGSVVVLSATVTAMLLTEPGYEWPPYLALAAVKDVVKRDGKEVFLLPGEGGRIVYVDLFKQLHQAGYRGDVSCEVSVMVWNKPGYDPEKAARACYAKMAPAMEKAGVRKRR